MVIATRDHLMFLMLMFLYALVGCLSVCYIREHYVYKCCVYWHVAQAFLWRFASIPLAPSASCLVSRE